MSSRGKTTLIVVAVLVGLVAAFWVLRLKSQSDTQEAALRIAAQNAFDIVCDESTPVDLRDNRLDGTADNRLMFAAETWDEATSALGLEPLFVNGWDLTSLAVEIEQLRETDLTGEPFSEAVNKLETYCNEYVTGGQYEKEFE